MEKALKHELETAIPALKDEIYPTNAPETSKKPYLVYYRDNTDRVKTLDGYTSNQALGFMFSVMASRYDDMKSLSERVEALLLSLPGRAIGENGAITVLDLSINNIQEAYEFHLKVNRGIIDFTIYF